MHIKREYRCQTKVTIHENSKDINKPRSDFGRKRIVVFVWVKREKKEYINRRGDENKNHIKPEERITELTREERFERGKKMETYESREDSVEQERH